MRNLNEPPQERHYDMRYLSPLTPEEIRARLADRANPNTVSQHRSEELILWTWRGENGFCLSIPERFGLHFIGTILPEGDGTRVEGRFGPTPMGHALILGAIALLWLVRFPALFGTFSFHWGGLLSLVLWTLLGYPLLRFGPALYYGDSRRNMLRFIETLLA